MFTWNGTAQDLHGGPDITAIRQARGRGPRASQDDIVHTCAIMMANPSSESIQTEGSLSFAYGVELLLVDAFHVAWLSHSCFCLWGYHIGYVGLDITTR